MYDVKKHRFYVVHAGNWYMYETRENPLLIEQLQRGITFLPVGKRNLPFTVKSVLDAEVSEVVVEPFVEDKLNPQRAKRSVVQKVSRISSGWIKVIKDAHV